MPATNYPLSADGGPDDLPRTLRREKEAREREARERQTGRERDAYQHGPAGGREPGLGAMPPGGDPFGTGEPPYVGVEGAPLPAVVRRIEVPFLQLMLFFLKSVLAMVPALLLLGAILWGLGQILQTFFPHLVKMQILIWFPN